MNPKKNHCITFWGGWKYSPKSSNHCTPRLTDRHPDPYMGPQVYLGLITTVIDQCLIVILGVMNITGDEYLDNLNCPIAGAVGRPDDGGPWH